MLGDAELAVAHNQFCDLLDDGIVAVLEVSLAGQREYGRVELEARLCRGRVCLRVDPDETKCRGVDVAVLVKGRLGRLLAAGVGGEGALATRRRRWVGRLAVLHDFRQAVLELLVALCHLRFVRKGAFTTWLVTYL